MNIVRCETGIPPENLSVKRQLLNSAMRAYPVMTEHSLKLVNIRRRKGMHYLTYRSRLKIFQNTLRLVSVSVQSLHGGTEGHGFSNGCSSVSSASTLNWRYSTVRVREPTIDHALLASPLPIYSC